MSKAAMLSILLVLSASSASATAMNPELSRCFSIREEARKHTVWKAAFLKFRNDNDLSFEERLEPLTISMRNQIDRLLRVQDTAELIGYDSLIRSASTLLADVNRGTRGTISAVRDMTESLLKLEDAIDDSFRVAQINNDQCTIVETSPSPQRNQRFGTGR